MKPFPEHNNCASGCRHRSSGTYCRRGCCIAGRTRTYSWSKERGAGEEGELFIYPISRYLQRLPSSAGLCFLLTDMESDG